MSSVHTGAMFFLRHLANMSCMVPFWASTGSGFVPIWGRVRSHAVWRRLFIVLMTAAHISPNVFSLWNFLSNILRLFLTVQATSFIHIIHYIYAHIYIFYLRVLFTLSLLRIFMVGWLPSVPCVRYTSKDIKQGLTTRILFWTLSGNSFKVLAMNICTCRHCSDLFLKQEITYAFMTKRIISLQ